MKKLKSELTALGIFCDENYMTAPKSSFRIGGEAALAVFPSDLSQLTEALRRIDRAGVPSELIGRGSNLLFAFRRYEGVLIFTERMDGIRLDGTEAECACGASLTALALRAAESGLGGLEFAYGIPGSVGGAVFMNAGAYGSSMCRVVTETKAYDRLSGETVTLHDHEFDYRSSVYMRRRELVCLQARLSLTPDRTEAIRERMQANMEARRSKQPLSMPSAGSYFKRPEGYFAGKLIEDAGLKGARVGDAMVSEKHAGFLVNGGNATARDVLDLERLVTERVLERFGVRLEREVRVISEPQQT